MAENRQDFDLTGVEKTQYEGGKQDAREIGSIFKLIDTETFVVQEETQNSY